MLCSKQYSKIDLLHLIVVPQISGGWQQNYSTKTKQVGCAKGTACFCILIDYRGRHRKGVAIYKAT
jgi:hypothetical protein